MMNTDARLDKANRPAAEALRLHPFYRGKVQILPKCPIRGIDDFAIWYTPGVAAACREIITEERVVPRMDDWELYPQVAATVGVQAQEEKVARICMTRDQLHQQATKTIGTARRASELLVQEHIIASPP